MTYILHLFGDWKCNNSVACNGVCILCIQTTCFNDACDVSYHMTTLDHMNRGMHSI